MLINKEQTTVYCGWRCPFGPDIIWDEDGISVLPSCNSMYRSNKLLMFIVRTCCWLFHISGDENYKDDSIMTARYYFCVLGFFLSITEHYTIV